MDDPTDIPAFSALVVAAGGGSRMGDGLPKQYRWVAGKPLLRHSLDAFAAHPRCGATILVVSADDRERAEEAASAAVANLHIVTGGASRRESVANGLEALKALPSPPEYVLIHDAARPGLDNVIIDRLLVALKQGDGAIPVLPVTDSLARGYGPHLTETVERAGLLRVQTPQAFHLDAIVEAHDQWPTDEEATDDARMLMAAGGKVAHVEGSEALMKITYADDLERYARLSGKETGPMRIGKGYDVHRLEEGEELWLCGLKIDHSHGLSGHSDADVAIHALCDAIFGALGKGDIGAYFPPPDEKWRGAASSLFLAEAMRMVREAGYDLANCDLTIICEAPKIGPHREAMRNKLAGIMQVEPALVSVKATTTEGLGFTGRREGIAADAIVLLSAK